MTENSSNDPLNSSENDEDFRVTTLLLRNDIRRRVHNGIEKRRKDKINYWIYKLAELLPFKEPKRESKTHLLESIYKYINELKEKNESLMYGNVNTINTIHVEEIRHLNKRCKDLEEKTVSYYRLLEMAGISPNSWPQDIQFERPTKYSKKITEQQLNQFLAKNSDKKSDKITLNNKRVNESVVENSGQSSIKRFKSSKSRSKKRKEREKERNLKFSPPTPVLPKNEMLSPNTSSFTNRTPNVSSGQTTSGPLVLLNDQNIRTVNSVDETPRLFVNTSNNGFNGLNTIQFRPTVGSQQLQFVSTTPTLDALNANTNLLSGQLLLNLNPQPPPPQQQTTAVILPNGQILPIITQSQPQQQPLILAPNQSFFLTTPKQSQRTIITEQSSNVSPNIKTNTINTIQNSKEREKQNPINENPKEMTTTIETIVISEKQNKKRVNKSIKKQTFSSKSKNLKKDKPKPEEEEKEENQQKVEKLTNNEKSDEKNISKDLETKTTKTSDNKITDNKSVISSKEKNKIKSRSSDKNLSEKTNENIVNSVKNNKNSKSKPVLTAISETPDKKLKDTSNCDILAKATQLIFSPPPNTCPKQMANSSKKKEISICNNKSKTNKKSNDNQKDVTINDNKNKKSGNKCKNSDLESKRLKSDSNTKTNEKEVISEFCAADNVGTTDCTSANIPNKANIQLINGTNKNENYVNNRTTSEQNHKIEKTIASGNKAETNKKSFNINSDANIGSGGGSSSSSSARNTSVENKLPNPSTLERTTIQSSSCQSSNARHESFSEQIITSNNSSDNNRLSFGFSSHQNRTNSNSLPNNDNSSADTQTIVNELPAILLSLNDANEVSTESVHSVSNSSLPAFLSLSPEHLNEYLPKDNITNSTENENSSRIQTISSDGNAVQFRINETNIEQHSTVRTQENNNRIHLQKEQQNYSQYPKNNESSVVPTTQSESRLYTSNFPTISSLITNDYSDFSLNSNKSMFTSNNSGNYFDNFNPNHLMNPKMNSQNNNFLQFPLQNDNSLMPLYPMHSYPIHNYLQNNTNSNTSNNTNRDLNTNRNTFFTPNENQSSVMNNTTPKASQNLNQSQTSQTRTQTTALTPQQSKTTSAPPPSNQSQAQNQPNPVMPMRSQRNSSTEQQLQPQQQRHSSQHTSPVASNTNSTNKTNSNSSVQYSTHNSFSSYSAEALIRQNEPTVHQIQNSEQNRYNVSANTGSRIAQQTHNNSNITYNSDRNSSRASISYSAESLIQSNSMNNSNQREVENESINGVNSDNNRVSYYQPINQSNNNNTSNNVSNSSTASNNLNQRSDPNNLFNFDHSLNSRIMSSNSISQNCGNSYPQITFNSHLPDIRTSTTTTPSEPLFPISSKVTPINNNNNSNRSLSTNSGNSISNNNSNNSSINGNNSNNQSTHGVSNIGGAQQQHSPVVYPPNNSQNPQQNKRSTNNTFDSGVNSFIHSNSDNYQNSSDSNMYSTTGPPLVDPNLNANSNNYQRSPRNADIRFNNCLQPSNQNPNSSMTQHNNPNNCFFANTTPNTTFFPPPSGTPFPPPNFLQSAPSPFDGTTPFSTAHRPPMFANTFMPDFNPHFVNTSANNPLPTISGSNFNINASITTNTPNTSNKSRETHPTNTRSASNISRSPNQSKHSKVSANNTSKSKKQNNSKHNESSNNSSSRHSNDNYLSMNDLISLTTPTNQINNRYSNCLPNTHSHNQSRQPVPSPSVSSSHSTNTNNKTVTSSADTSSSYPLFRPQSQNNSSNASNVANFSVNSLQTSNRTAPTATTTSTPSNFGPSSVGHHSSHATNFHLSNIFPDINSGNESLAISPMKFPPPVTPVVPPPVATTLGQTAIDTNTYTNHHSSTHHQNLYPPHHSSARISTPHNSFNTFLSSGSHSTHNPNSHSFDPQITANNRTSASAQMPGIGANTTHSASTLGTTHSHSHHSYANIVPSFNF